MRSEHAAAKGKKLLGALVLTAAVVALAHAPFARSALMSLGGCPFAGAHMTAVEAQSARHLALTVTPAKDAAPARPAPGFALDSTVRSEVDAWATREHLECRKTRQDLVTCVGVPPEALGRPPVEGSIDELTLQFDARDRLVDTTVLRGHLSPQAAAAVAQSVVSSLETRLGPAGRHAGTFDAARLSHEGAESIATVMYRYSDYVADVTAMNAPAGGPSILEHYTSARD